MNIWLILMIAAIIIFLVIPSLKERIVLIKKLIITPIIFLYLLFNDVTTIFYLNVNSRMLLILGLALGIGIGMFIRHNTKVKIDLINKSIRIPGTYLNLIVFILIFSVHFAIGYLQAVNPQIFHSTNLIEQSLLFLLAVTSSITLGASICLYYKYFSSISNLSERGAA